MNALPIFYSFRRCPYAMRARLALAVGQYACELREIELKNKPTSMLMASPKGTVPVLVLPSGQVLEQSLDIMLWALQQNDPAQWLAPSHGTLADMLALVQQCDTDFKPLLDRCKYPNRYPGTDASATTAAAHAWLQGLQHLLEQHAWLAGTHAALADMAVAPFVRQFAGINPAAWQAQPWPHLQAWLARWQSSALFAQVMEKVPTWSEGTTGPVVFTSPAPN